MEKIKLTEFGHYLDRALRNVLKHDEYLKSKREEQTFHAPNAANVLVYAYEQLRTASENIEDHLLLQAAIRRFYKRNFPYVRQPKDELASELLTELTQARYIQNDTVPLKVLEEIETLINEYHSHYREIGSNQNSAQKDMYTRWLFDILTVRTEQLLNSSFRDLTYVHAAHNFFSGRIEYNRIIDQEDHISESDYPSLLYIAIHKVLLKSDDANARCGLLDINSIHLNDQEQIRLFNENYDKLATSASAVHMAKFVQKNSPALRIIKDYFFSSKEPINPSDLNNAAKIRSGISHQIMQTTEHIKNYRNKAVVKSILFLLITKALLGLLIEIPYDLLITGSILVAPLLINLIAPPAFLALTALTFKLPGKSNKEALEKYIYNALYGDSSKVSFKYKDQLEFSPVFTIVYTVIFVLAIYIVARRLEGFGFNIVQGLIFFIFFSTAAFLGYRITLQIKEIEHIQTNQGVVALIRTMLYSPFVYIGQKISYRFGKLNLIARILDTAVDIPLKTFTKLLRQWVKYLNILNDRMS